MVIWKPKSAKVYPLHVDGNIFEFSVVSEKDEKNISKKASHSMDLKRGIGTGAGAGVSSRAGAGAGAGAASSKNRVPLARSRSCQASMQTIPKQSEGGTTSRPASRQFQHKRGSVRGAAGITVMKQLFFGS
uniref:Uncharacterized protein n=1 Tax=Hanusia phi TaxID=3032 RepID=A0A7S0EX63_9CRYP|mmetsp:Transcript_33567/g.75408  ORF Transcript_33567/g.75408 Transcript_33567/m.75408 type:complete len:131 (+) Transcript_33567:516-908(+)